MRLIKALNNLADQLSDISFATDSHIDNQDLRIIIDANWTLPFDMTLKNRRAFTERAQLAKFGHKEQTIQDLKVRNTWEISASQITIQGEKWQTALQTTLQDMAGKLGFESEDSIQLELHNLLLYEKGQFFARHQDTEKSLNMVATLIVVLPSPYSGGELLVQNKDQRKCFSCSSQRKGQLHAILFYADSPHEIKPVRSGNRLALTYNVCIKQKPLSQNQPSKVNSLTQPILRLFSAQDVPKKTQYRHGKRPLVILLDHQYSQKGLSWDKLKGRDRKTIEEFLANKDHCGLEFALALIDVKETREANEVSNGGYRSFDGYDDEADDDEDDFDDEADDDEQVDSSSRLPKSRSSGKKAIRSPYVMRRSSIELGSMIAVEYEVKHWLNEGGKNRKNVQPPILDDYVISMIDNSDFKAFESEYEGYMGNWGNTMDSWYHRAALVLWRKSDSLYFEFDFDPDQALQRLHTEFDDIQANNPGLLDALLPKITRLCEQSTAQIPLLVISTIEKAGPHKFSYEIAEYLIPQLLTPINIPKLKRIIGVLGEIWLKDALVKPNQPAYVSYSDPIFRALPKIAAIEAFAPETAAIMLQQALDSFEKQAKEANHSTPSRQQACREAILQKASNLFKALALSSKNNSALAKRICQTLQMNVLLFRSLDLAGFLTRIDSEDLLRTAFADQLKVFKEAVIARLKSDLATFPKVGDWAIQALSTCNCADCKILNSFIRSSDTNTATLPLSKGRRQHLHQQITSLAIPVSHETVRTGSPFKLVLKKLPILHHERSKDLDALQENLTQLGTDGQLVAKSPKR